MWHNKEGSYNIFIPISQFQSKGHGQLGISLTSTMRGSYMVLWISPSLRFSRKNQMGCSWEDFPLYSFHDNLLNNDVLQVAGRERPTFISKLLCSRLQFSVGYLKQSSQQAYEMVTMISSMVQIKKAWPTENNRPMEMHTTCKQQGELVCTAAWLRSLCCMVKSMEVSKQLLRPVKLMAEAQEERSLSQKQKWQK